MKDHTGRIAVFGVAGMIGCKNHLVMTGNLGRCAGPGRDDSAKQSQLGTALGRFTLHERRLTRSTERSVLIQGVVPAFEDAFAGGLLEGADVAVEPEDIEAAAGFKLVA